MYTYIYLVYIIPGKKFTDAATKKYTFRAFLLNFSSISGWFGNSVYLYNIYIYSHLSRIYNTWKNSLTPATKKSSCSAFERNFPLISGWFWRFYLYTYTYFWLLVSVKYFPGITSILFINVYIQNTYI